MKGEVRRERESLKDLATARVIDRSPLPTSRSTRTHNHPASNPAMQEPTPVTMRAPLNWDRDWIGWHLALVRTGGASHTESEFARQGNAAGELIAWPALIRRGVGRGA